MGARAEAKIVEEGLTLASFACILFSDPQALQSCA
jgi:hypothetical protein